MQSKKKGIKFIFDKSAERGLLDVFGRAVDKEDYIIDKKSGKRVKTPEGEGVKFNELAGVMKGSEIYIKSNIDAIIKFLESIK